MMVSPPNHRARLQRVLRHVERHPDHQLDLAALSGVAALSPRHFHRQFTATLGLSVHRYVQLARMKPASYRLAYRGGATVTEIALDAGYDAPDAFARAFRRRFGQSPSGFRISPVWTLWLDALAPHDDARIRLMEKIYGPDDVTIRDIAPIRVAVLEHRGDPATVGATIRRLIAWRKARGLSPAVSTTFNVFHTDRRTTPPANYRIDLCVGTDRPIAPGDDLVAGIIPGGRCAVIRVVGGGNLAAAALYLCRDWLPRSGHQQRDFPLYCQRLSFFPDVPEDEAIADLFLPLF